MAYKKSDSFFLQMLGGLVAIIVVIFILAMMVAWPFASTPADKIALNYGGGPFEGSQYQKTVGPGSGLTNKGFFDKWYMYPITVRDYTVSKTEGEGDRLIPESIKAGSANGPEVEWEVTVNFKLNTSKIRSFHEQVGLKFKAFTDDGWDQMLDKTIRPNLEAAVQSESRKHTTDEYQRDPNVIEDVRQGIAQNLKASVNEQLGDDFFCGPTHELWSEECPDFEIVVKRPTLPQGIIDAYNAQEAERQNVEKAKQEALQAEERARGRALEQKALEGLYNDPNYVAYLQALALQDCARNTNCTLVVTPSQTGLNVNVGQ